MTHFVIVYRRTTSEILERRDFADDVRDSAIAERARLELKYREDSDVEVVLLTAQSEAALRKTHDRYFSTGKEMVFEQLKKALRLVPFLAPARRGS